MKKTTTFNLTNSIRKKDYEKWLDEKGRIIREIFFDTFPNGEESIHKYENELLVESTYILEGGITKNAYNYDSEGRIINQPTLIENFFADCFFGICTALVLFIETTEKGFEINIYVDNLEEATNRLDEMKFDNDRTLK
jgi:hypothetical protein